MSKIKEILFNCLKRINIQIFVFLFFLIATFIVSFFRIEKKNDFIYEPYWVLCGIYFFLCLFYPIIYILTLVFVKKEYIKKIMLFFLYLITFFLSFFLLYLLWDRGIVDSSILVKRINSWKVRVWLSNWCLCINIEYYFWVFYFWSHVISRKALTFLPISLTNKLRSRI